MLFFAVIFYLLRYATNSIGAFFATGLHRFENAGRGATGRRNALSTGAGGVLTSEPPLRHRHCRRRSPMRHPLRVATSAATVSEGRLAREGASRPRWRGRRGALVEELERAFWARLEERLVRPPFLTRRTYLCCFAICANLPFAPTCAFCSDLVAIVHRMNSFSRERAPIRCRTEQNDPSLM